MEEFKSKLDALNDTEKYESFITPEEDYQFCLNTERLIGKEEGIKEGMEKGYKKILDIAKTLKSMNYSIEEISKITNLSINELKKI